MRQSESAEKDRIQEMFTASLRKTQPFMVPFMSVPQDQRSEYLKMWRIRATDFGSMSTRTKNGNESAEFLHQERDILQTYYADPVIKTAAQEESTPEYLILPEMYRDWGLYLGKLTALTGDTAYLEQSVEAFNRAISLSPDDSSVHNVAVVERFGIDRRAGRQGKLSELKKAYRDVIQSDVGGWDRKAAVSWMYITQSGAKGRVDGIVEGSVQLVKALKQARKEGVVYGIAGKEKKVTVRRYIERRIKNKAGEISRRKTFTWNKDEIREKLELPPVV